MSSFLEIIQAARTSHDPVQREQYESKLLSYIQQSPNEYLNDSLVNFSQTQLDPNARQMIALILNKALVSDNSSGPGIFYDNLNEQQIQAIKTAFLNELVSNINAIKKSAASVIALVFQLDYTRKGWFNLLTTLHQSTSSDDLNIKSSSLYTLGYICENFSKANIAMSDQDVKLIIRGICEGLDPKHSNEDIMIVAAKSLRDSLQFSAKVIEMEKGWDYIFELLI